MSYQPAFLEVYIGWVLCALWSYWLVARGSLPSLVRIPWIVGGGVLLGQVIAVFAVFGATGAVDPRREWALLLARWGSASLVLAAMAILLAATIVHLLRRE